MQYRCLGLKTPSIFVGFEDGVYEGETRTRVLEERENILWGKKRGSLWQINLKPNSKGLLERRCHRAVRI